MSDYSIYPNAIDGYAQIPLAVDRQSPINASGVNRLRSAIINIENTLGITPAISQEYGAFPTVAKRLDFLDGKLGSLVDTGLNDAYLNGQTIETTFGGVGMVGSEYFVFRNLSGETVARVHSNDFGLVISSESKEISIGSGGGIEVLSDEIIQIGTNNSFMLLDDYSSSIISQRPGDSPALIIQSADAGFGVFAGEDDPRSGSGISAPTASIYHMSGLASGSLWLKTGPGDSDWADISFDGGENNTASNVGAAGVGLFKQKSGDNLEFKSINAASPKIILFDNLPSDQLDIDVANASVTQRGAARIATQSEVDLGADSESIVTPATLAGSSLAAEVSANSLKAGNATHTGDVTGDSVLTISANAVSNSKLAQMQDGTIKGNNSGGIGDPLDLSSSDVTSMLDLFAFGLKGLVPASTGGSGFLKEDGSWSVPDDGEPPNEVLITQLSDFPAPVSGEITLDSTKIYRISGIVDIGSNSLISAGPILMYGGSWVLDGIVTDTANPLINHTSGFQLDVRELSLSNPSGPVYDVDGASASTSEISINRSVVTNSLAFGSFMNIARLDVQNSLITSSDEGLIIDGSAGSISFSNIGVNSNSGTFTWLTLPASAAIDSLKINGCRVDITAGQTGLDLSASATIANAPVKINNVIFSGAGTPLIGVTKADPKFEFLQCVGISDSTIFGSAITSGGPAAIVPTSSVPLSTYIDIGTAPPTPGLYSSSPNMERFILSNDQSGELTYIGPKSMTATVRVSTSLAGFSGATRPVTLAVSMDTGTGWVICPESEFGATAQSSPALVTSECTLLIPPGAKIKPQLRQIAGAPVDIEAYTVHVNIHAISL